MGLNLATLTLCPHPFLPGSDTEEEKEVDMMEVEK